MRSGFKGMKELIRGEGAGTWRGVLWYKTSSITHNNTSVRPPYFILQVSSFLWAHSPQPHADPDLEDVFYFSLVLPVLLVHKVLLLELRHAECAPLLKVAQSGERRKTCGMRSKNAARKRSCEFSELGIWLKRKVLMLHVGSDPRYSLQAGVVSELIQVFTHSF